MRELVPYIWLPALIAGGLLVLVGLRYVIHWWFGISDIVRAFNRIAAAIETRRPPEPPK